MFTPPVEDLSFTLFDIVGLDGVLAAGGLDADTVTAILAEAGRFSAEVLAPLNRVGDEEGCRFDPASHTVTTAPGWKDAYKAWCEAGWPSLPCPEEFGGQGLPTTVSLAVQELWNTAVSAYGIGTLLTQGAVEAIEHHATAELKQRLLPAMVAGQWTGTMCLTEAQAGSDLAAIKTRAEPAGDGAYRITGTKIFITYGEHDLTDNIIHLVLARLPGAPEGTRGISLFAVPKFLIGDDGCPGERNDVKCIGLEHKLGIHGSPTCTMRFGDDGGAIGYLVGEENRGLNCMFTMMNNARLHVGMQGVAVAERASQQAIAYAFERKQGRKSGGDGDMVAIIEHADVRRMALDMRARTAAARTICYRTALAMDLARLATDDDERQRQAAIAAFLTPIAKAFGTDTGEAVASTGIQIHGGMGFIEETGAAQHLRDVRITQIYEGTNGIQALDLVGRKLLMDEGRIVAGLIGEISALADGLGEGGELAAAGPLLKAAAGTLEETVAWVAGELQAGRETAFAGAKALLTAFGATLGAAGLVRGAMAAHGRNAAKPGDGLNIRLACYYASNHLPAVDALCASVRGGARDIVDADPELLRAE